MRRPCLTWLAANMSAMSITAMAATAELPVFAGTGENPALPPPSGALIPTFNFAKAKGWPPNAKPLAAPGLEVTAFASGLDHPRWIYVLPNGDVLVAETNTPTPPDEGISVKAWLSTLVKRWAGFGAPSANRITLLRDSDDDGVADTTTAFLEGLNSPLGMALIGNDFYVANTDAVLRYQYVEGQTRIANSGTRVVELPAGPTNQHWTRNLVASRDGSKLYVTVGSNSNVAENGMESEVGRAAIWEVDVKSGHHRLYATGLRNPVGLAWEPDSRALWTTVNERDHLGDDLVPDYMTAVRDSGFYGWPYSYFGQHVDGRATPPRPDMVAKALRPDYALGAHTASLGLAFAEGSALPAPFRNGAFIGQHGSWNRTPHSGYKVIFVPFADGKPAGDPSDVLTGFLSEEHGAYGRPVGVALDKHGALLVADDVGNVIWRVTPAVHPVSASTR